MKIKIKFEDEKGEYNFPDISYEKFMELIFDDHNYFIKYPEMSGISDTDYERYLKKNNMKYPLDLNSETTPETIIEFDDDSWDDNENNRRILKFKCRYDSEWEENKL